MAEPEHFVRDPWEGLRRFTRARIALGRAGGSLPTRELLQFQAHHAGAIDAVYAGFDPKSLATELDGLGYSSIALRTQAEDRQTFLLRPDLGRRLSPESCAALEKIRERGEAVDIVAVAVDGLSALAVHSHFVPLVANLLPRLARAGFRLGPIPLVTNGRVALQDEIGAILGARLVVSFIGERPGLGAPDSLGAYLVYHPKKGNTDANRNCVSNIRPEGLGVKEASDTLFYLISEALKRKISGVELKDQRELLAGPSIEDPPRIPS